MVWFNTVPSPGHHARWGLTTAIAISGCLVTLAGAFLASDRAHSLARQAFERKSEQLATEVTRRLILPSAGLRGARGAFVASERVDYREFITLIGSLDLASEFPGVRGFGWIEPVRRGDVARLLADMRAEGQPPFEFRESPDNRNDLLYVVRYMEPYALNPNSVGIDAGSVPAARAAIEQAIDQNRPVLSSPITLQRGSQSLPSLIMFLPVYQGSDPMRIDARRAAVAGLLVAPLVLRDLLVDVPAAADDQVTFQLYAGHEAPDEAAWIAGFHAHGGGEGIAMTREARLPDPGRFTRSLRLDVYGQPFTLVASTTPLFDRSTASNTPWIVLVLGLLLTGGLSAMAWQGTRARERAEAMARSMTADLERLAVVARRTSNAVVITDTERRITWVNEGFERITGFTAAEVLGRNPGHILQFDQTDQKEVDRLREALRSGASFQGELLNRAKDGTEYWIELEIQPLLDESGTRIGFMAIESDISDRKRSERLVADYTERFRLASAAARMGVWEMDLQHGEALWDSRTWELYGARPGDGDEVDIFTRRVSADDRHRITQAVKAAVNGDGICTIEFAVDLPDGSQRQLLAAAHVVRGDNGEAARLVGVLIDTTERHRSEEALRASQSFLDQTGRIGGIGGWELNLSTQAIRWTDQTCRIHDVEPGHQPTLADGIAYYEPEARPLIESAVQRAIDHGEPFDLELPFVTAKGRALWVRAVGERDDRDPANPRLIGAIQDVTARRAAEEEARRASAMMISALEVTGAGLVIFDPDDRLVYCNDRYRGMYKDIAHVLQPGVDFETVARASLTFSEPPEAAGRHEDWLRDRLRMHREGGDWERRLPDGTVLRVVERPLPDGHVVSFRFDITEVVRSAEAAQAASRAKSQFLANMSHEIRTPMNAILGMLALLQRTGLNDRQLDYARNTEAAARSLLGLLNDILDFSKVEAGKLTLDEHPFEIDRLLRELAVLMSASVGDKDIEVLYDLDPALPDTVIGDPLRLRQILVNLAGNAIKFTDHGEVVLAIRVEPGAPAGHTRLALSVRDTGIGIAPENQARIFQGFTQAEASTTRRFGGTGLGLAISQRLVALMGSELTLQSELGKGTCFRFTLDLPTPQAGTVDLAPARLLPGARVMVVDDNDLARSAMVSMARANGWRTEEARSGAQALALLAQALHDGHVYEAVFLDWRMPVLDGLQVATRIRQSALRAAAAAVVMVTAHARDWHNHAESGTGDLLDGYLVKPVTASLLADALRSARARHQPPALPAPVPASARASAPAGALPLAGVTLLLVEDNEMNRLVATELLREQGARVEEAVNGQEAVDRLRAEPRRFDAVLMDLQMPVMDGLSATRAIRDALGLTALPIVAMTANAMASDRDACLAGGMNDHVGKPFDLDQLVAVLQRWTGCDTEPGTPVAAAPVADARAIDVTAALRRLGGNRGTYRRLLTRFIDEHDRLLVALSAAVAHGDVATALREAHTLKGLAGMLGAAALAERAAAAEHGLQTDPHSDATRDALTALKASTVEPMKALLAQFDAQGADEPTPTRTPAAAPVGGPLAGMPIVVVDDSDIAREMAEHVLTRLGAVCTAFDRAAPALEHLRRRLRPAAVLMDIQMPEIDGLEATRRLRDDPRLGNLPVVGLSATTDAGQQARARDAGMSALLPKPLEADALLAVLRRWLPIDLPAAPAPGAPAVPAPSQTAVFDAERALARVGHDEAFLRRALQRLLDEFGGMAHEPPPSVTGDARQAAARLHKLKGIALSLEAGEVAQHAAGLELALSDGAPAEGLVVAEWRALGAALERLRDHVGRLPDAPTPAASGPADEPLAPADLTTLCRLLRAQDLDALALHARLQAGLNHRLGTDEAAAIAQLIDGLRFEDAAQRLEASAAVLLG